MATIRNIAQGVSSFTSNAFLVDGERTVLVDAGNDFDAPEQIEPAVGTLDRIVLTHTHPDHVGNVGPVVEAFDVEVWGFDAENDLVDYRIDDGDYIEIGDYDYEALHTPGHKDDHLCLFSEHSGNLFAGDLVFANGGFGRTDLPEGDRTTLIESIKYLLSSVEASVSTMYVGHGPTVDVDPERHIELALEAAQF